MITPTQALKIAARDTIGCLFTPKAWREVRAGAIATAFLLLRLLMLVTFPISIPLAAWCRWEEARLRAGYDPVEAVLRKARQQRGVR